MTGMEIIRDIMEKERVSLTGLGKASGKSPQNLSNILNGNSPKTETFVDLLNAMGYRVYVTKGECNGYEVGGEQTYDAEAEIATRAEIQEIKKRLSAIEAKIL